MSLELSTRTLGDWLEHWAEVTPDKEYIVYSDRNLRFTWGKFNERVDNMAKGLISIGVERGTHVGIWAGNVPDWLTFLYSCAKIGAVEVAYGKRTHVIEAGDSIYYDSIVPHHVHGFQGQQAKILAVVYTPI